MGTWGTGNFDDDTAADHLSALTGRLLDETRQAMNGDPSELTPDEFWGVAVPLTSSSSRSSRSSDGSARCCPSTRWSA